jgi:N-acetylglutamate synthase-like GNAT family acetyltransferase
MGKENITFSFHNVDQEFIDSLGKYNLTDYVRDSCIKVGLKLYVDMKEFYKSKSKELPTRHFVVFIKENCSIVGYRHFYYNPSNSTAELFSISIDPAHRGQGYAKELIIYAIEHLLGVDVKTIRVPIIKNDSANEFLLERYYKDVIVPKYPMVDFELVIS